jgi:Flp pilus assembly pilin Flp
MKRICHTLRSLWQATDGGVFVEYLLLLTIVGIGVITGLTAVRAALLAELMDLAAAMAAMP